MVGFIRELVLASQISLYSEIFREEEEELGMCHTSEFSLPSSALCSNFHLQCSNTVPINSCQTLPVCHVSGSLFSDFSENVNRLAQCGFRVQFEGVSYEQEVETVMHRYLVPKKEVGQLASDVERIQEAQESSEKLLEVSPADLLQDVSE